MNDPHPMPPNLLDQQRRQIALDMALRYFPAKTAKQLVEYAKEFETYLKGSEQ